MQAHSPVKLCTSIFVIIVGCCLAGTYLLNDWSPVVGIAAGQLLAYLNIISGFWVLRKYFKTDTALFLKAVFGSMILRMLLTLSVFTVVIATTKIHKFSFTVSLVFSYILYSVIEIIFIHKNLETDTDNY